MQVGNGGSLRRYKLEVEMPFFDLYTLNVSPI